MIKYKGGITAYIWSGRASASWATKCSRPALRPSPVKQRKAMQS